MQDINLSDIRTDQLSLPALRAAGIQAGMLRLDLIHPEVSGNKWFKLRYYLDEARELGKKRILTFGGAWSNHILATAAACRLRGFKSVGIIRGEEPVPGSSILQQAVAAGMELVFTSRTDFSAQRVPPDLTGPDDYIIQAGGYGIPGAAGAGTILDHCTEKGSYSHLLCAVGTGTMLAGLRNTAAPDQQVIGISVMKNNLSLETAVQELLNDPGAAFRLLHDHHLGGYAKKTNRLLESMNEWYRLTGIPTDFVYTGKLCYAFTTLVTKGFFPSGSRVLLIHSGGLSGNASLEKGTLIF